MPSAPTHHPPPRSLRSASRPLASGLAAALAAAQAVGEARLRLRVHDANPERVPMPSAPTHHPPPRSLRSASRPLASGLAAAPAAAQAVGEARLRLRVHDANPERVPMPSAPTHHPPPRSLRSASRPLASGLAAAPAAAQAVGEARLRLRVHDANPERVPTRAWCLASRWRAAIHGIACGAAIGATVLLVGEFNRDLGAAILV